MKLFKLKGSYSDLWKAIIRPERDNYDEAELGPKEFAIGERAFERTDLELVNERGHRLKCSHFEPLPSQRVAKELPCVIYLHGNCSSRLEALPCAPLLLPAKITLFALDLSGSGRSQGDYISLGWYERDDLKVVIEYLRKSGGVSTIGLWGRSMGAVTSLLHGDRDPSIAGMVLDSPFSSLRTLAQELCKKHVNLPKLIMSGVVKLIRSSIKKKAKFDINELTPITHVDQCFIPAFFVVAKEDDFIGPHHGKTLYEKYAGDKNFIEVAGDHNSERPEYLMNSIAIFFYNTLQCHLLPDLPKGEKISKKKYKEFNYHTFQDTEDEELIRQAIQLSLESHKEEEGKRDKKEEDKDEEHKVDKKKEKEPESCSIEVNKLIEEDFNEMDGFSPEQRDLIAKVTYEMQKQMHGDEDGDINSHQMDPKQINFQDIEIPCPPIEDQLLEDKSDPK
jgi:hypothetical protein